VTPLAIVPATYSAWLLSRGPLVTHAHCPEGCEHPQPFVDVAGLLWCGRCWFMYGCLSLMVGCTPETCGRGDGGNHG
jgi:hypothetical protein